MGLKQTLSRLFRTTITIDQQMASHYGMVFVVDIKGKPVDPKRVFNEQGTMNPGFSPIKWEPPVLIIHTPEQLPVAFRAVTFEQ